ncbi:phosphatase PAP2 family protein [Aurantimonas sp. 22II-16-19i]|uniref:phosphatase PAP2 family protein n=1 Tax=Aurantimonas sp. 22II-16-19i TaxID=1317114 RepID=UPI0009F7F18F|nr:phosphatase PAP2 family protein [Aurantimonas sp. 22II-16-19i]ORE90340.1 putative PAP2 family phosphatase [Aurantimonas sp. 22II-16-19i]
MRGANLIVLVALIVPVTIFADEPLAAWAATLPIRLAESASTLSATLGLFGLAVALVAVLISLAPQVAGHSVRVVRHHGCTATLVAVSAVASLGSAALLKHVVGRIRPSTQGADPWRFEFMAFDDEFAAWPSVHAAVAAAIVLSLSIQLPHLRRPLLIAGVAACLARVLAGAHWPSDVMSGWALGAAMVAAAQLGLARRRLRRVARDP